MSTLSAEHLADSGKISASYDAADQEFKEAVKYRVDRLAEAAGLLDAEAKLDPEVITERAYKELKTKQVVSIERGKDDRFDPKKSSSKEELAAVVFRGHLSAADSDGNAVEARAYDRCIAIVWAYTVPTRRGRVQQRLEADKLLLVRGRVYRNGNKVDSGVFVTKNPELVLREYLDPRLEALRKLSEELEGDFSLALEREKSLEGPMKAAIQAAISQATATLPVKQLATSHDENSKTLSE
jgi:hypothetical protein